jgi:hypothetical protein
LMPLDLHREICGTCGHGQAQHRGGEGRCCQPDCDCTVYFAAPRPDEPDWKKLTSAPQTRGERRTRTPAPRGNYVVLPLQRRVLKRVSAVTASGRLVERWRDVPNGWERVLEHERRRARADAIRS